MNFSSLLPFVPGGSDYSRSKALFLEMGFELAWEADAICEFQCVDARFLLQDLDNREFQENYMLRVGTNDLDVFYKFLVARNLHEKFPEVKFSQPEERPWGTREMHLIDLAGVCWHFH